MTLPLLMTFSVFKHQKKSVRNLTGYPKVVQDLPVEECNMRTKMRKENTDNIFKAVSYMTFIPLLNNSLLA